MTAEHLVLEGRKRPMGLARIPRGCDGGLRMRHPRFHAGILHAATSKSVDGFFRSGRVARTGDGSSFSRPANERSPIELQTPAGSCAEVVQDGDDATTGIKVSNAPGLT